MNDNTHKKIEGAQQENRYDAILERINMLDAEVKEMHTSLTKMRKLMFWRLAILVAAILVPTIVLPIFIQVFFNTYLQEYLVSLQALI